jgi:hypothetical protein
MELEIYGDMKEILHEQKHFHAAVEAAKRGFGEWDLCDPVVWAILEVVRTQTAFATAMEANVCYGENDDMVEAAIEQRRKAIVALTEALESEPRGFQ